jgi:hypothetical protein
MLYDLSQLRTLSNNDETFIIDILETFRKTNIPSIQRMHEYLAQEKYEAIGREPHKMIPGVSFLGAKPLQDILVVIEENAKEGKDLDNMSTLVKQAGDRVNELVMCFKNDFKMD